jgi:DNA-binding SARP family transcriptional activator/class 3 adenylate cyclase/tetratricopeptide (TPR) repeat protein
VVIDIGADGAGRRLQHGDELATGRQQLYVARYSARFCTRMDFRILGPLEVLDEGREVALGGSRQRALLALLVLHANETLSTDRLIEELWGEHQPATAAKTVQVQVSRLRKALAGGGDLIVTRDRGYRLELEPDWLDAHRFERLLTEARDELGAERPERAAALLERGLALWRGEPLADLAYEPFAQREIARLADLRVAAIELEIDAKLALGGHAEVVGQLEFLIAEHPFRERLRGQLMLALYRSDRQADALQAYQNARRKLVDELGIEPGERLRELERAILAQDPALALVLSEPAPAPSPPEPPPPGPQPADPGSPGARRLVSIVFADLVGSTGLGERLDPESMHALLDRYTEACGAVIERHGGSVEGFIGDAVVGVFGLAAIHEDDALRAVRAAVEMRAAGAALSAELERERGVGIGMKLGVESGEVFLRAGARRSPFAAGDAFNVASRLEGTAAEGEILIGENTYPLVRDFVRAEPLEPLALKGRAAKVQAWRLVELEPERREPRAPASPFVNRAGELEALREAFARARDDRACHSVVVIGPAGIGKSRLVKELLTEVGDEATVAVGRCVAYGEDVAYRPLAEIVGRLGGDDPRAGVERLLAGEEATARLVLGAVGLSEAAAPPEEAQWAVRRLLERAAAERPLLVVFDDVHWADPTLLDLLDYLVAFCGEHPILLACLARPDFVQTRPGWATPMPNRSLMVVDALPAPEALELVEGVGAAGDAAARIVETAEGNPLFLEQLVAVGADDADSLPSSIQAVLAARIDRLDAGERAVLEAASVQGRSFHVGALVELLDVDEPRTATHLVSLVRQQLIRSERSELPGQDAFRFAHALIREAAYNGLAKERRAAFHEHVARWLEREPGAQEETIGFHLAEAHRLLTELGLAGERELGLAAGAAERFESASGAALQRADARTGARLLERAAALMGPDDPARVQLLPRLGAALLDAGRLADADSVLTEAIARAPEASPLAARARVEQQLVQLQAGTGSAADDVVESALSVLEGDGDELGQYRALWLRALRAWIGGRCADADEDFRRAGEHARRAGDQAALFEVLDWRASAALFGPTAVGDGIRLCQEVREQVRSSPVAEARALQPTAALHAMAGDFEEARRLVAASDAILSELGDLQSAVAQQEALVELLAGQPAAAEARLRTGYERLMQMGEKALLASTAAMLAQALYAQGRLEEAAQVCEVSEQAAAEHDISAQVGWRAVRAKLLAPQRWDEAHELATEAVRLAERTDFLTIHADALVDLAEVLRRGGRADEAAASLSAAQELFERKGDVASAARVRALQEDNPRTEAHRAQVHDGKHQ